MAETIKGRADGNSLFPHASITNVVIMCYLVHLELFAQLQLVWFSNEQQRRASLPLGALALYLAE